MTANTNTPRRSSRSSATTAPDPRFALAALPLAMTNGVADALNAFGERSSLPALSWTLLVDDEIRFQGTHTGGRTHANAESLCERWANLLGLDESGGMPDEGCRYWSGNLGDWRLALFSIHNPTLYSSRYPSDPVVDVGK